MWSKSSDAPDRSFIAVDYEATCNLLKSQEQMRIQALAAIITLFGIILALPPRQNKIEEIAISLFLTSVIWISIRSISSINNNVYAKCIHLEKLEIMARHEGYFCYWNHHVIKYSGNASSNAFVLSCKALNFGSYFYLTIQSARALGIGSIEISNIRAYLNDINNFISALTFLVLFILAALIWLYNMRYIEKTMITKNMLPELRKALNDSMNAVYYNSEKSENREISIVPLN